MSAPANSPAQEKAELLTRLRQSAQRLLATLDAVPAALAAQPAAEGRWSVLGCMEHVVASEAGMLKLWQERAQPGAVEREKDAVVLSLGKDRSRPRNAPEVSHPKGKIATVDEARAQFVMTRAATIAAVEATAESEFRAQVVPHRLVETADGYQLFLIVALHAERHAEQIQETAAKLAAQGGRA